MNVRKRCLFWIKSALCVAFCIIHIFDLVFVAHDSALFDLSMASIVLVSFRCLTIFCLGVNVCSPPSTVSFLSYVEMSLGQVMLTLSPFSSCIVTLV